MREKTLSTDVQPRLDAIYNQAHPAVKVVIDRKRQLEPLGKGEEKIVYPLGSSSVISFFSPSETLKEQDPDIDNGPEAMRKRFYIAKLAHLLYPEYVPDVRLVGTEPPLMITKRVIGPRNPVRKISAKFRHFKRVENMEQKLYEAGFGADYNFPNFLPDKEGGLKYVDGFYEVATDKLIDKINSLDSKTKRLQAVRYLKRISPPTEKHRTYKDDKFVTVRLTSWEADEGGKITVFETKKKEYLPERETLINYDGLELRLIEDDKSYQVKIGGDAEGELVAEAQCWTDSGGRNKDGEEFSEPDVLHLYNVENYSGPRGTATKLIRFCLEEARRRGFRRVRAGIMNPAIVAILHNLETEGLIANPHFTESHLNQEGVDYDAPVDEILARPNMTAASAVSFLNRQPLTNNRGTVDSFIDSVFEIGPGSH